MDTEVGSKSQKTVVLVGATGRVGSAVARALLARGAALRLLVRPGSRAKLAPDIAAASEVVEDGAGADEAYRGVYSVVSAVQGGPDTIIDAQVGFLRAAREAGVRRFIPSDYSVDLFDVPEGQVVGFDWRRAFARRADVERGAVEVVHLFNGMLLDRNMLFWFAEFVSLEKGEVYLWGDGSPVVAYTAVPDIAAYTAEAALDDSSVPEVFAVAGESLDFHQFVREVGAGLGRPFKEVQRGTLADLDAEIDRRRQSEPNNIYAWMPLTYWRVLMKGQGKLRTLMNDRYLAIRPAGVAAYLAATAPERA